MEINIHYKQLSVYPFCYAEKDPNNNYCGPSLKGNNNQFGVILGCHFVRGHLSSEHCTSLRTDLRQKQAGCDDAARIVGIGVKLVISQIMLATIFSEVLYDL